MTLSAPDIMPSPNRKRPLPEETTATNYTPAPAPKRRITKLGYHPLPPHTRNASTCAAPSVTADLASSSRSFTGNHSSSLSRPGSSSQSHSFTGTPARRPLGSNPYAHPAQLFAPGSVSTVGESPFDEFRRAKYNPAEPSSIRYFERQREKERHDAAAEDRARITEKKRIETELVVATAAAAIPPIVLNRPTKTRIPAQKAMTPAPARRIHNPHPFMSERKRLEKPPAKQTFTFQGTHSGDRYSPSAPIRRHTPQRSPSLGSSSGLVSTSILNLTPEQRQSYMANFISSATRGASRFYAGADAISSSITSSLAKGRAALAANRDSKVAERKENLKAAIRKKYEEEERVRREALFEELEALNEKKNREIDERIEVAERLKAAAEIDDLSDGCATVTAEEEDVASQEPEEADIDVELPLGLDYSGTNGDRSFVTEATIPDTVDYSLTGFHTATVLTESIQVSQTTVVMSSSPVARAHALPEQLTPPTLAYAIHTDIPIAVGKDKESPLSSEEDTDMEIIEPLKHIISLDSDDEAEGNNSPLNQQQISRSRHPHRALGLENESESEELGVGDEEEEFSDELEGEYDQEEYDQDEYDQEGYAENAGYEAEYDEEESGAFEDDDDEEEVEEVEEDKEVEEVEDTFLAKSQIFVEESESEGGETRQDAVKESVDNSPSWSDSPNDEVVDQNEKDEHHESDKEGIRPTIDDEYIEEETEKDESDVEDVLQWENKVGFAEDAEDAEQSIDPSLHSIVAIDGPSQQSLFALNKESTPESTPPSTRFEEDAVPEVTVTSPISMKDRETTPVSYQADSLVTEVPKEESKEDEGSGEEGPEEEMLDEEESSEAGLEEELKKQEQEQGESKKEEFKVSNEEEYKEVSKEETKEKASTTYSSATAAAPAIVNNSNGLVIIDDDASDTPHEEPYIHQIGQGDFQNTTEEDFPIEGSDEPRSEEVPVLDDAPIPEETPALEETPIPEEASALEATPALEETPVPEEASALEATPALEETPVPEEAPGPEEAPNPGETPASEEALVLEEVSVLEEALVLEEAQSPGETSACEETPIPEEAPVLEEALVLEETLVLEEALSSGETSAHEETPALEEAPTPEEAPSPEETPIPKESLAFEEIPIPEEAPTPGEISAREETPIPEEAPVLSELDCIYRTGNNVYNQNDKFIGKCRDDGFVEGLDTKVIGWTSALGKFHPLQASEDLLTREITQEEVYGYPAGEGPNVVQKEQVDKEEESKLQEITDEAIIKNEGEYEYGVNKAEEVREVPEVVESEELVGKSTVYGQQDAASEEEIGGPGELGAEGESDEYDGGEEEKEEDKKEETDNKNNDDDDDGCKSVKKRKRGLSTTEKPDPLPLTSQAKSKRRRLRGRKRHSGASSLEDNSGLKEELDMEASESPLKEAAIETSPPLPIPEAAPPPSMMTRKRARVASTEPTVDGGPVSPKKLRRGRSTSAEPPTIAAIVTTTTKPKQRSRGKKAAASKAFSEEPEVAIEAEAGSTIGVHQSSTDPVAATEPAVDVGPVSPKKLRRGRSASAEPSAPTITAITTTITTKSKQRPRGKKAAASKAFSEEPEVGIDVEAGSTVGVHQSSADLSADDTDASVRGLRRSTRAAAKAGPSGPVTPAKKRTRKQPAEPLSAIREVESEGTVKKGATRASTRLRGAGGTGGE